MNGVALQILRVPVTVTLPEKLAEQIILLAEANRHRYICLANAHMLVTANNNREFLGILEKAEVVAPDGLPLVWLLRYQGAHGAERVSGTDLTLNVCKVAAKKGMPVSFVGSTPETLEALEKSLSRRFPGLKAVAFEPLPALPERPKVDFDIVRGIQNSGARIIFVGLGCPKQEFWMSAYSPHLPAVLIGVGAAFDFLGGTVRRAPAWMQKAGLEWLHRLLQEPLRLWRRYLLTNTLFAIMVLKELLKEASR
jgi:N-acetylglucosaminyldiphosphoundecaprenol N-acetyl-beta-D-mannosaminyltransferase